MKRVKELNERKSVILIDELRRMQVSYKEGEQPVQVDYDYAKTREEVKSIDDEVRKIRHLTALANCTAMTDEGCTISEALVLLAQLNAEKVRVERLAAAEKLTRRITPNGVLEYTVCNYDPAAAAADPYAAYGAQQPAAGVSNPYAAPAAATANPYAAPATGTQPSAQGVTNPYDMPYEEYGAQ